MPHAIALSHVACSRRTMQQAPLAVQATVVGLCLILSSSGCIGSMRSPSGYGSSQIPTSKETPAPRMVAWFISSSGFLYDDESPAATVIVRNDGASGTQTSCMSVVAGVSASPFNEESIPTKHHWKSWPSTMSYVTLGPASAPDRCVDSSLVSGQMGFFEVGLGGATGALSHGTYALVFLNASANLTIRPVPKVGEWVHLEGLDMSVLSANRDGTRRVWNLTVGVHLGDGEPTTTFSFEGPGGGSGDVEVSPAQNLTKVLRIGGGPQSTSAPSPSAVIRPRASVCTTTSSPSGGPAYSSCTGAGAFDDGSLQWCCLPA